MIIEFLRGAKIDGAALWIDVMPAIQRYCDLIGMINFWCFDTRSSPYARLDVELTESLQSEERCR